MSYVFWVVSLFTLFSSTLSPNNANTQAQIAYLHAHLPVSELYEKLNANPDVLRALRRRMLEQRDKDRAADDLATDAALLFEHFAHSPPPPTPQQHHVASAAAGTHGGGAKGVQQQQQQQQRSPKKQLGSPRAKRRATGS